MEWLVDNLYLILVCISLLLNLIIFIVTKTAGNKASNLLKVLNAVNSTLPDIIAMAEKVGATGDERKNFAMGQVKMLCQAMGLKPTEEHLQAFSKTIDELVGLTKAINNKPNTQAIATLEVK